MTPGQSVEAGVGCSAIPTGLLGGSCASCGHNRRLCGSEVLIPRREALPQRTQSPIEPQSVATRQSLEVPQAGRPPGKEQTSLRARMMNPGPQEDLLAVLAMVPGKRMCAGRLWASPLPGANFDQAIIATRAMVTRDTGSSTMKTWVTP